jgi:hypothetical protein
MSGCPHLLADETIPPSLAMIETLSCFTQSLRHVAFACVAGLLSCASASEWRPLFSPTLDDATFPEGAWKWESGALTASVDEVIWTRGDFSRFELELEFKLGEGANSGVIIYADPSEGWIPNSVEIQLADDFSEKWRDRPSSWHSGALFGRLGPSAKALLPAGEWNRLHVRADGRWIVVRLNGRTVVDADLGRWTDARVNPDGSEIPRWLDIPAAELPTIGKIGLQGKHAGAPVWFRNARVRPLTTPTAVQVVIENEPTLSVTLENAHVRARYGSNEYARGALLELLDKSTGYDAAGSAANPRQTLDNSARNAEFTRARVLWQTPSEVAVELHWGTGEQRTDVWDPENKRQIVVLRADSPVLRIVYVAKWHLFEWGTERTTGAGAYHVVGAEAFAALRGVKRPYFHHKETEVDESGTFFKLERDGLDVPINHRGYVIMGVYNSEGRGYVRVMQLADLPHLKLMGPPASGYESYRNRPGTVAYLAPINGGAAAIEALGKAIVDRALAPGASLPTR